MATKKKEKKPTYHRIFTRAKGYEVYIDELNRPVQGIIFSGTIDKALRWTLAGQLMLTEADAGAMFGLSQFTIRAHKYIDKKEYVLRLLDCSLKPGPDYFLNISRVIFWRPKAMDVKEPRWEPTLNLENC